MSEPGIAWLPGGRLHLSEGPIDLICQAEGPDARRALEQAVRAMRGLLAGLAAELPLLRAPLTAEVEPTHPVARLMVEACRPHAARHFITPMAAVAGSVAQYILSAMLEGNQLARAYVNNGGDIALHLASGQSLAIGLVRDLAAARPEGRVVIEAHQPIRGVATSGWPGRSFSLGIAEAVTVLAPTAAMADAAASMIANAVNAEHPAITRSPACDLCPDSDLGDRLVTTHVGPLPPELVDSALRLGLAEAAHLRDAGLIVDALLCCQGRIEALG
ncbi:UPF0280 family protein [Acetobacteraceae bacterium H6797]|nr:UPF0280 family protein [Acetobacteraceae bacterium H6797]